MQIIKLFFRRLLMLTKLVMSNKNLHIFTYFVIENMSQFLVCLNLNDLPIKQCVIIF